jgi:hypothetical protein
MLLLTLQTSIIVVSIEDNCWFDKYLHGLNIQIYANVVPESIIALIGLPPMLVLPMEMDSRLM